MSGDIDSCSPVLHDSTTLTGLSSKAFGNHIVSMDFPELIRTIEIPNDKIHQIFGTQDLEGIYLISPDGDSMVPTIPVKALVFVDSRINRFTGDGIYVFAMNGYTYMKRLQRKPDNTLKVISDNKVYESFNVDPREVDFHIAARFLCILPLEMLYI